MCRRRQHRVALHTECKPHKNDWPQGKNPRPAYRQSRLFQAFSYEPGNRAGLVCRTNFVLCSYGKFQPGYQDEKSRTFQVMRSSRRKINKRLAYWKVSLVFLVSASLEHLLRQLIGIILVYNIVMTSHNNVIVAVLSRKRLCILKTKMSSR